MSQQNNPVNVALVGLSFGAYMIDQMSVDSVTKYVRIHGVCDLDQAKAKEWAAKLGAVHYPTLDHALADPDIEAIALFTGPAGRAELIRKIIRAGKHVLTTKPFERDSDSAKSVLEEAVRLNRVVTLNSPSPHVPNDLAQVEKWRKEFDLGRAIAARFDVYASYNETADGRWYDDPAQCPVAPIFRIGIYLINDAVRLFGEASDVAVFSSKIRTGRPTPDNAQLSILFQSGATANIFASFCIDDGDAHRNQMTLNFERGTIYRNSGPVRTPEIGGGSELSLVMNTDGQRAIAAKALLPDFHPQMAYQWETFHGAVRGTVRIESCIHPKTVAAGVRIIEAMTEAQNSGGIAKVKPVD